MPFLRRLRQTPYWAELTDTHNPAVLEEYVVADIHPQDRQQRNVVFLLESPHTHEILRGHPLAGRSGTAVTKVLGEVLHVRPDEQNWPLGEVLTVCGRRAERALDPRLLRIGVMEVSELPMQMSAYRREHKRRFGAKLLKYLKTIRKGPGRDDAQVEGVPPVRARRGAGGRVQQTLIADLQSRIAGMGELAYFVPCGEVARVFLNEAAPECAKFQGVVPHPASQGWQADELQDLIDAVNELLD